MDEQTLLRTHTDVEEFDRQTGQKSKYRVVTPYVRLVDEDHQPVIIKDGGYYSDGGQEITPDEWVHRAMSNIAPAKLEALGFKDFKYVPPPEEEVVPKVIPATRRRA